MQIQILQENGFKLFFSEETNLRRQNLTSKVDPALKELKIYITVMGLRPLHIVLRSQILTFKVGPRTERVKTTFIEEFRFALYE